LVCVRMAKRSLTPSTIESCPSPSKKSRILLHLDDEDCLVVQTPFRLPCLLPILPGIPISVGFLHGRLDRPVLWVYGFAAKNPEKKGRLSVFPLTPDLRHLAFQTYVTYRLVGHFQHYSSVLRQSDALVLVRSVPSSLHTFWVETTWDLLFPPFHTGPPMSVEAFDSSFPPCLEAYDNLGFLQLSLLCFTSYFIWVNPSPSFGSLVSVSEDALLPVPYHLMLTPDVCTYILRFIYALDIDFYVSRCRRYFLPGASTRFEEEELYSCPLPTVSDLEALLQSVIP
jgi:hypothetical protein